MATITTPVNIPIIDVSSSLPDSQVAEALVNAAAAYGFVYVKSEGKDIPIESINRTFELVGFCNLMVDKFMSAE